MLCRIAVVLLAAGGSTRLGSAKQLLTHEGKSLLRRAAEAAVTVAAGGPVVVVLGARAEAMRAEVAALDVRIVVNPAWEQGMGGSVRWGMEAVDAWAEETGGAQVAGVLLLLCDQPLVGAAELGRLVAAFAETGQADAIAAAAYAGTVGVPVVFGRMYFEALRTLPADAGAKGLLRRHEAQVVAVPLPEGAVDIDTREQYAKFTNRMKDEG